MKRVIIACGLFACMATASQSMYAWEPNDSVVHLVFEPPIIDPETDFPRSPILMPSVYQDGHTLYLYSGCTGATLRLLDADEEVFSTEITDEMDEICIPSTLVGTYRLEIIRGAFTFYCDIEL